MVRYEVNNMILISVRIYKGVIGVVTETHHLKREDPLRGSNALPPVTALSLYSRGHQLAA